MVRLADQRPIPLSLVCLFGCVVESKYTLQLQNPYLRLFF